MSGFFSSGPQCSNSVTKNTSQPFITQSVRRTTCVVEDGAFEGTVLKEGVGRRDIFKVAVLKQGILKLHRLYLNAFKPKGKRKKGYLAEAETNGDPTDCDILRGGGGGGLREPTCHGCTLPHGVFG